MSLFINNDTICINLQILLTYILGACLKFNSFQSNLDNLIKIYEEVNENILLKKTLVLLPAN